MEHEELTEAIIGCAFRVHNTLGFGFLESVYERSLMIELAKAGLHARSQVPIQVTYEGEVVGDYIADIVVEDTVIIELKSVLNLALAHEVQLVHYLTAMDKEVGLLINFGEKKVDVKRKVKELPPHP